MIYIIRHGQTEQNNRKILAGRANYQLNETGIAQALEAGKWLQEKKIHLDLIISSPLDRALKTAALVAPDTETQVDERSSVTLSIIRPRMEWSRCLKSPQGSAPFWKS